MDPGAETPTYQVVVAMGTDHHPFQRLVGWIDRWAADNPDIPCFVQHGTAPPPVKADGAPTLAGDELRRMLTGAQIAVGHAGPGTIMDARNAGLRPIVVPRLARHGEVVDDHQVAFAVAMHAQRVVILADDEAALRSELDSTLADPSRVRVTVTERSNDVALLIGDLIDGLLER